MYESRPSRNELLKKIFAAKRAVENENVAVLNLEACISDAIELDYDMGSELITVLMEVLNSISPDDYAGSRPPQRSYEVEIDGLEIYPFVAEVKRFNCRVYLKFALQEAYFWLVSLHRDRPRGKP